MPLLQSTVMWSIDERHVCLILLAIIFHECSIRSVPIGHQYWRGPESDHWLLTHPSYETQAQHLLEPSQKPVRLVVFAYLT